MVGAAQVHHLMLHIPGRIMRVDILCVCALGVCIFHVSCLFVWYFTCLLASLVPVLSLSNLFILEIKLVWTIDPFILCSLTEDSFNGSPQSSCSLSGRLHGRVFRCQWSDCVRDLIRGRGFGWVGPEWHHHHQHLGAWRGTQWVLTYHPVAGGTLIILPST